MVWMIWEILNELFVTKWLIFLLDTKAECDWLSCAQADKEFTIMWDARENRDDYVICEFTKMLKIFLCWYWKRFNDIIVKTEWAIMRSVSKIWVKIKVKYKKGVHSETGKCEKNANWQVDLKYFCEDCVKFWKKLDNI